MDMGASWAVPVIISILILGSFGFNQSAFATTPPSVQLSSTESDPTKALPIPMTATFSEDVTGFELADITVTNGVATNLVPTSASVYTFGVEPSSAGTVTVNVAANVATDAAGNGNTAAAQFSIDSNRSFVTLDGNGSGFSSKTYREDGFVITSSVFNIDSGFGGIVMGTNLVMRHSSGIGFALHSIDMATLGGAPNQNATFTCNKVGGGSSSDTASFGSALLRVNFVGLTNCSSITWGYPSPFQIVHDNLRLSFADIFPPTLQLSSTESSPTNASPIPMTATFNEVVTGFELGEISVGNGVASNLVPVSGSVYTFDVTPSDGTVTVNVAANVAIDAVGNGNTAAAQFSIESNRSFIVLDGNGAGFSSRTYREDGFVFTSSLFNIDRGDGGLRLGTSIRLQHSAGIEFALNSVDIKRVGVNPGANLVFTCHKVGGGSSSDTASVTSFSYQRFALEGLNNCSSITWRHPTHVSLDHDNFVLSIANTFPVANAGGSYQGNEGANIALDASGSTDPDGMIVLYEWDYYQARLAKKPKALVAYLQETTTQPI